MITHKEGKMLFLKNFKMLNMFFSVAIFLLSQITVTNFALGADTTNLTGMTIEENPDGSFDVKVEATKEKTSITREKTSTLETVVVPRNVAKTGTVSSCGDGFCAKETETAASCATDCDRCGDRECSSTENCVSCTRDCGSCVCGDGECIGETCSGCTADCSPCCGDGTCQAEAGETAENCSQDCGSGGGGCFLAGTLITMADGTTKPIESIQVGDMILAFDEQTQTMKPDKVAKLLRHPPEDTYLIVNSHLKVTSIHRVLSKGEWIPIGQLKVGDTLTNAQGQEVPIESIVLVKEKIDIYNFEVNPYHTYVADGYIVHNAKPLPCAEGDPGYPQCP